jgi:hypothetical protein
MASCGTSDPEKPYPAEHVGEIGAHTAFVLFPHAIRV